MSPWPSTAEELIEVQSRLGQLQPEPWHFASPLHSIVGCFVCWPRGDDGGTGAPGDRGWAAAAWMVDGKLLHVATASGEANAAYAPGLLALREGPLLEAAILALRAASSPSFDPEVLLVNATGRDHPLRAGLALHLGARLEMASVGATNRTLLATGAWPEDERGASSPLHIDTEIVARWVRTRRGTRPVAAHAAWRTEADTARAVVLATTHRSRTPEPIRHARRAAREARTQWLRGR
jgi:deoxyribonuclease V